MTKQAQDNYRVRHRLQGLCLHCFRSVHKGGLCQLHYDDNLASKTRQRRAKNAAAGFPNGRTRCRRCGQRGHNARTCKNPPFALLPELIGSLSAHDLLMRFAGMIPDDISVQDLIVLLGKLAQEQSSE